MQELQKKLIEWAEKIGDIASEQLPDFAEQIIAYEMWSSSIWMNVGIGLLCFFGFLFFICLIFAIVDRHNGDTLDELGAFMLILILISIPPCGLICTKYSKLKKCEVAPKLVIIDYLRGA